MVVDAVDLNLLIPQEAVIHFLFEADLGGFQLHSILVCPLQTA